MNRTERLAWESGFTTGGKRRGNEAGFTTGAKVTSTLFIAGIVVLLLAQIPFHSRETAAAQSTPIAEEQSDDQARTFGSALSLQKAEAAARAAQQDDPPIRSF